MHYLWAISHQVSLKSSIIYRVASYKDLQVVQYICLLGNGSACSASWVRSHHMLPTFQLSRPQTCIQLIAVIKTTHSKPYNIFIWLISCWCLRPSYRLLPACCACWVKSHHHVCCCQHTSSEVASSCCTLISLSGQPQQGSNTPLSRLQHGGTTAVLTRVAGPPAQSHHVVVLPSGKKNLAQEAFKRHISDLQRAVNPDNVTWLSKKLSAKRIISKETCTTILLGLDLQPHESTFRLLSAVQSSIGTDYHCLRRFVRVLKREPLLRDTAERLQRTYCKHWSCWVMGI